MPECYLGQKVVLQITALSSNTQCLKSPFWYSRSIWLFEVSSSLVIFCTLCTHKHKHKPTIPILGVCNPHTFMFALLLLLIACYSNLWSWLSRFVSNSLLYWKWASISKLQPIIFAWSFLLFLSNLKKISKLILQL